MNQIVETWNPLIADTPERRFGAAQAQYTNVCRKQTPVLLFKRSEPSRETVCVSHISASCVSYDNSTATKGLLYLPNVEFLPACEPCNVSEFNGLHGLWMCISHLIVFNIIFLWGLFLFRLLAELIPFLSQHVGGAASNQLTNTDHRQAGGKWLPTLSAPLSLKQHFTNAEFELITWRPYYGTTWAICNYYNYYIQRAPW